MASPARTGPGRSPETPRQAPRHVLQRLTPAAEGRDPVQSRPISRLPSRTTHPTEPGLFRGLLVRRGALRAVIALPAGLMPPAGIGLQIWVLTQPDEHQPPTDRLLFVDAAAASRPLAELIGTAWRDYRSGRHADVTSVHRAVPVIEVLDDQVDLTPQRYLPPPGDLVTDPTRTIATITQLDRQLKEIRHGLPKVRTATATALRTAPQASLA